MLLLVKLQTSAQGFFMFFKLYKWYQIEQSITQVDTVNQLTGISLKISQFEYSPQAYSCASCTQLLEGLHNFKSSYFQTFKRNPASGGYWLEFFTSLSDHFSLVLSKSWPYFWHPFPFVSDISLSVTLFVLVTNDKIHQNNTHGCAFDRPLSK